MSENQPVSSEPFQTGAWRRAGARGLHSVLGLMPLPVGESKLFHKPRSIHTSLLSYLRDLRPF